MRSEQMCVFSTCWRSPHKFKIYISNLCARTNISNLGWVGIHTRERFTCKKNTVYNLCKWLSMIINDYVYAIYACLRKAGILVGLLLPTVVATPWGPLRSTEVHTAARNSCARTGSSSDSVHMCHTIGPRPSRISKVWTKGDAQNTSPSQKFLAWGQL